MEEWTFICPTKIYFKNDGLKDIGNIIKDNNYSKIFLIYGKDSFIKSGNYNTVTTSLKENKIEFKEASGVGANPDISFVREVSKTVKEYNSDLILACGGGSVIDAVKSIAHAYYYDKDPLDFNKKIAIPTKSLPLGVVLTLSASGSEMSNSCVISDRENNFKGGFNHYTNYPTFALLDPTLTYSVSPFQTACGLVDILSHSFERYFCTSQKFELSDYLALSVIKQIIELSQTVMNNPNDYEARRAMMLCGSFSHNGWTGFGKTTKMHCHGIEHTLSGRHPEIAHGEGLRFLLAEFIKVNYDLLKDKIAKFGKFVFDENDPSMVYNRLEKYFSTLPLRHSMRECGISESEENELLLRLKLN